MTKFRKITDKLSSFQIIILGFAGIILFGACLLTLPVSSQASVATSFHKALFTATSAVCVTGLVVEDTATYWSYFGQAVILILIQIGGLGIISVASYLFVLSGRKVSLMQRQTIQNALSAPQLGGIIKFMEFVFAVTFAIEGAGALILMPGFVSQFGASGIWMSVFHSVSAFCNAGFDLMGSRTGKFTSLTSYAGSPYITIVISLLIVFGGLGFLTWEDILTKKGNFKIYRMQSKVIIVITTILLVVPAVMFFFVDFAKDPMMMRICKSIFQAVTPRTAGFNTADYGQMTEAGRAITMILMVIGGSPGSTAGGMKTTTIAVLYANIMTVYKRKKEAGYFGRRIEDSVVRNAATIVSLYFVLGVGAAIAISLIENLPMQACMFETLSAIATVGLSLGLTPNLSLASHLILIFLMFFGRMGGLTIIYAGVTRKEMDASRYPVENIMVG